MDLKSAILYALCQYTYNENQSLKLQLAFALFEKHHALQANERLEIEHKLSFDEANRLLVENCKASYRISQLELELQKKNSELAMSSFDIADLKKELDEIKRTNLENHNYYSSNINDDPSILIKQSEDIQCNIPRQNDAKQLNANLTVLPCMDGKGDPQEKVKTHKEISQSVDYESCIESLSKLFQRV